MEGPCRAAPAKPGIYCITLLKFKTQERVFQPHLTRQKIHCTKRKQIAEVFLSKAGLSKLIVLSHDRTLVRKYSYKINDGKVEV